MATSGTYDFAPSAGDLILGAFGLVQVRRWELTQQHLTDAHLHANLQMVDFSNRNPNTWANEVQEFGLSDTVPTYNLEGRTIAVTLVTIETTDPAGNVNSRVIGPLSGNDYAALPWRLQPGVPTSYYFNLLTPTPTISFWPVPNADTTFAARVRTFRQMQDVVLPGGVGIDSPYRFLDAFMTGLAWRLARVYPPKPPVTAESLKADYLAAFTLAAQRDQESTPMSIAPIFTGYFR